MPVAGSFARQISKNVSFEKVMPVAGSFANYFLCATWGNFFAEFDGGRKVLQILPVTGITF